MRFDVEWMPEALSQLSDIWSNAADRAIVTTASHQIDPRLASNPQNEGEGRGGMERITFEFPLRVLFRVFEAQQRVEVHSVGVFSRRD